MHPNSGFSAAQVLWTLSFASLLVLLVVLLGRERSRRFKFFTIAIVLVALERLIGKLLFGRVAPMQFYEVFIPLAVLSALVSVLVLVELARKAFVGLERRAWIVNSLGMLAVGAVVVAEWGKWPAWQTVTAGTTLAVLELLQAASQKINLLSNVLTVELALLVLFFGRRFKAGWRSHTQAILIGLSTASIAQMLRDGVWQLIAMKAAPKTQVEYNHIIGIRDKLSTANEIVYLVVVVWWIVSLWIDEPGTGTPAQEIAVSPEHLLTEDTAPEAGPEIDEPKSD
ncbi:MAG: hypothetical protein ABR976_15455 [Terracidiphilus sp.]|jgi:hypothetical protein